MNPGPKDEDALFHAAVQDVRPLSTTARAPAPARKPPPRARFSRGTDPAAAPRPPALDGTILAGDELRFFRPGVPRATQRALRRGQLVITDELDLHGLPVHEATPLLHAFLGRMLARGATCVRIIHGKGLRSGRSGPVLKQCVDAVLRAHPQVMAFTSPVPELGGTGAVHVLLRGG